MQQAYMDERTCMISYTMYSHIMSNLTTDPKPDRMSSPIRDLEQHNRIEYSAVVASLGWSGWGSPVGLGALLVAVGIFLVCLHVAGILH